jgi:hypothetical protein
MPKRLHDFDVNCAFFHLQVAILICHVNIVVAPVKIVQERIGP